MKIRKINTAWEQWLAADDWTIFATFNFSRLNLLQGSREDAAAKLWRSCLNTVDRALYGQTESKPQPRFNRVAFKHYGSNGDNPNLHLLIKAPIDTEQFCVALNAIWATQFEATAAPAANSIAPIITKTGATGYGLHEEYKLDTGSVDDRLTYINSGPQHPVRTDALQRLRTKATRINLIQAQLALPQHIKAAQANYERRERAKAAALLRP
jgi:hypothetical protein